MIERTEALALLKPERREELHERAHETTERCVEKRFDFCSIINARSGRCSENCKWCAQSAHWKTGCETYGWVGTEACVKAAKEAAANGADRIGIVTSGRKLSHADVENVLHPIAGTPLGSRGILDPERVVDSVAILRLVNPSTPLRFAGGRRDMTDETAAKCIYVGMSAGIAGPLLTTPGADFNDDRSLAVRACYAVGGKIKSC